MPDHADPPEDPADALYGLDPGAFVAARNDLVRALRKERRREDAAVVAELRRPSPAAWAVNQLSRRRGAELDGLVRLGQALRDAQARALEGADAQVLRQAGRARRDAVGALADAGVAFLAERGPGAEAHAGEIVATLEAASLDPRSGEAVLAGRLTVALQPPSGFGQDGADPSAPAPRHRHRQPDADADADAGTAAARAGAAETERRQRAERAGRAVIEAGDLATRLDADAAASADAVARHEVGLRSAEARVVDLERDLDEARHATDLAARALTNARTAAADAEAAASDARQRVVDAEARVEALEG